MNINITLEEYRQIYKTVIRNLYEEHKISISECLYGYDYIDEYCNSVRDGDKFDINKLEEILNIYGNNLNK